KRGEARTTGVDRLEHGRAETKIRGDSQRRRAARQLPQSRSKQRSPHGRNLRPGSHRTERAFQAGGALGIRSEDRLALAAQAGCCAAYLRSYVPFCEGALLDPRRKWKNRSRGNQGDSTRGSGSAQGRYGPGRSQSTFGDFRSGVESRAPGREQTDRSSGVNQNSSAGKRPRSTGLGTEVLPAGGCSGDRLALQRRLLLRSATLGCARREYRRWSGE